MTRSALHERLSHEAAMAQLHPLVRLEKHDPITIRELETIAQAVLPKNVYDYYACGSDDEDVVKRNESAFQRLRIFPRVLRDVSAVDTSSRLFGWRTTLPVAIAPSAMQKLANPDGELAVARAAAKTGLSMTLSTNSTTSLEDVMDAARDQCGGGSLSPAFWFQLYLRPDMNATLALVKRAEAAGYQALVVTVDTPVLGNRLEERRTPLVLPAHLELANLRNPGGSPGTQKPTSNRVLMDARTAAEAEAILKGAGETMHSAAATWETIEELRKATSMRIVLKGIMTAEDAELAVDHGVDAIVVSNHGGRQLDCTPSTIEALPHIAEVVRRRIPIIVDGGVRRGSDVFKAVGLGADLVLIGRPVLWGLSYGGQRGVETVVHILERELSRTMALAGVQRIADIERSMLGVAQGGFGVAKL